MLWLHFVSRDWKTIQTLLLGRWCPNSNISGIFNPHIGENSLQFVSDHIFQRGLKLNHQLAYDRISIAWREILSFPQQRRLVFFQELQGWYFCPPSVGVAQNFDSAKQVEAREEIITLPETNSNFAPENGWFSRRDSFPLWNLWPIFTGLFRLLSESVNVWFPAKQTRHQPPT